MTVSLTSLFRFASTETPQAQGRGPSVAADVNIERVVLQAYRAIGDRHLFEPNFRTLSAETYRGFASADPALSLETSDTSFTVKRDGREVMTRPTPANTSDGRAWGGMLAELLAGSIDSSTTLQESDRQTLVRKTMAATTKQARGSPSSGSISAAASASPSSAPKTRRS